MADLFSEAPARAADVKIRSFAAGGPPRNLQPVVMIAPSLSAPALIYNDLVCNPGSWDGYNIEFGYQWIRDASTVIPDAVYATYSVTYADKGHTLKCQVTGMNAQRSLVFTTAPATIAHIAARARLGGRGALSAQATQRKSIAARFSGNGRMREFV